MPQIISFDFVRNRRTWPDNAHIAAHHIQQLRQLSRLNRRSTVPMRVTRLSPRSL
jgi:hypothetical protein